MSAKKDASDSTEVLYRDMSSREKLVFIGKALVFFISGGFIYPTLWID
jgi:hypothetical protein